MFWGVILGVCQSLCVVLNEQCFLCSFVSLFNFKCSHFYITLNMVKLFFRSLCNTRSLTFMWLFFALPVELLMTKPLGTFMDVSRHSFECCIWRHLVFLYLLSKFWAIRGLKKSVGLKLSEHHLGAERV